MAPRIHDADLCERIRKLEERVKELETRPPVIAYPPLPVYPTWPAYPVWPNRPLPYWTVWGGTTDSDMTITGIAPTISSESTSSRLV